MGFYSPLVQQWNSFLLLATSMGQHGSSTRGNGNSNDHHNDGEDLLRQSQLAFAPTTLHKGLINLHGENNCFLNVMIQALWHIGPFRIELQKMLISKNLKRGHLISVICDLFMEYQFAEKDVLPAYELREILTKISSEFELGSIADSVEALDLMLDQIHAEACPECPGPPKCLAHHVFGGSMLQQIACSKCGALSEPSIATNFVHPIYAREIIKKSEKSQQNGFLHKSEMPTKQIKISFASLIKSSIHSNHLRCPDASREVHPTSCTGRGKVRSYCLDAPLALAFSVAWTSGRESAENIQAFLSLISMTLNLGDLMSISEPGNTSVSVACPTMYIFRGMVCYYGKHYISFFHDTSQAHSASTSKMKVKEASFLLFDDAKVRAVGSWAKVKATCVASRLQPVLLLYELRRAKGANQIQCDPSAISLALLPPPSSSTESHGGGGSARHSLIQVVRTSTWAPDGEGGHVAMGPRRWGEWSDWSNAFVKGDDMDDGACRDLSRAPAGDHVDYDAALRASLVALGGASSTDYPQGQGQEEEQEHRSSLAWSSLEEPRDSVTGLRQSLFPLIHTTAVAAEVHGAEGNDDDDDDGVGDADSSVGYCSGDDGGDDAEENLTEGDDAHGFHPTAIVTRSSGVEGWGIAPHSIVDHSEDENDDDDDNDDDGEDGEEEGDDDANREREHKEEVEQTRRGGKLAASVAPSPFSAFEIPELPSHLFLGDDAAAMASEWAAIERAQISTPNSSVSIAASGVEDFDEEENEDEEMLHACVREMTKVLRLAGLGPRASSTHATVLVRAHDVASALKLTQLHEMGRLAPLLDAIGMSRSDSKLLTRTLQMASHRTGC